MANIVTTSKALVTSSDALVTSSFLFLVASCSVRSKNAPFVAMPGALVASLLLMAY